MLVGVRSTRCKMMAKVAATLHVKLHLVTEHDYQQVSETNSLSVLESTNRDMVMIL